MADDVSENYTAFSEPRDRYQIFEAYYHGREYKFTYELDGELIYEDQFKVQTHIFSAEYTSKGYEIYFSYEIIDYKRAELIIYDHFTKRLLITKDYKYRDIG